MYCFAKPDILNIAWHSKLFCKIISGPEKEDCLLHCWPDIWRGMQESSQAGQDWLVAFCVYFHATLQYITDQISSIENGLFMLETSGRGTLNTRQACAVESAAMRSGLVVHLVMLSTHLDLRENTTCQLYMSNNNIRFFTIDLPAFAIDSPLGKIMMDWKGNNLTFRKLLLFQPAGRQFVDTRARCGCSPTTHALQVWRVLSWPWLCCP